MVERIAPLLFCGEVISFFIQAISSCQGHSYHKLEFLWPCSYQPFQYYTTPFKIVLAVCWMWETCGPCFSLGNPFTFACSCPLAAEAHCGNVSCYCYSLLWFFCLFFFFSNICRVHSMSLPVCKFQAYETNFLWSLMSKKQVVNT